MFMSQPHTHYGVACTVKGCGNPFEAGFRRTVPPRKWTEKEDYILRDYHERRYHWAPEVAALLGTAPKEVRRRWGQLERAAAPRREQPWTRREDLLLLREARKGEKGGLRKVAEQLDRTPRDVSTRVSYLRKLGKLSKRTSEST